jgi:hypothetical protein
VHLSPNTQHLSSPVVVCHRRPTQYPLVPNSLQ